MTEEGCVKDCLTPEERQKILGRFHSLLYWVGELVPELEVLEGREVPLKEVVFRFITEQFPSEETVQAARGLSRMLEAKARTLERALRTQDLERERAYRMMHEALGLLRAVDELRDVVPADREVKARSLVARVSDERRWLEFVRNVKA